ncbi:hypothetical protein [Aridibaculum aurantiacum]|uniref:hypothetical protein n=1 Tax=Aridibaculum aurantiacum TaxID=2810307 RepID=UPI001A96B62F|nr:hypothetical protein [Aridibaculum aurantiacum]
MKTGKIAAGIIEINIFIFCKKTNAVAGAVTRHGVKINCLLFLDLLACCAF